MLTSDLRHAWRALSRRAGSSLATILVFAVGIGLVTAIFALTDPYVLRPLPYADEDRLVMMTVETNSLPVGSSLTLDDFRGQTSLFKDVAAYSLAGTTDLALTQASVPITTVEVTNNYFNVLGVPGPPASVFRAAQSEMDIPVVLTAHGQRVVGGRLAEPGVTLPRTDGGSFRIAGTLPQAFYIPDQKAATRIDGMTPFEVDNVASRRQLGPRNFAVSSVAMLARLQPGVTPETAQSALAGLSPNRSLVVQVKRVRDVLTAETRPLAAGALAAGVLILLTCAANVANLLVARAVWRTREFATREALGASRLDIARLWLLELALMSAAAVGIGLTFTGFALATIGQLIPIEYATLGTPTLTWRIAGFAALSGVSVMLVGVSAATAVTRSALRAVLGHGAADVRRTGALRVGFATVQSAFAMVLAVGAAMLAQSYAILMTQNVGYDRHTLSVRVTTSARRAARGDELDATLDRLRRLPGVRAAGASTVVLKEMTSWATFVVNGNTAEIHVRHVTPGFFDAAGIAIRQGHDIGAVDRLWETVVVNEAFARAFYPAGTALGQAFLGASKGVQSRIVGVVQDAFDGDLVTLPAPRIYAHMDPWYASLVYVIRTASDPLAHREPIRRAIKAVNPTADLGEIETIGRRLNDTVRDRTFATLVLTFFGLAGGVVAIAGLVGIVTFVVARRTREIAIRIALGACRGDVRRLVIQEAVVAALGGGLAGLLVGRWLSTGLEALVYGVQAGNWTTSLVAGAFVIVLMIGAAIVSAKRAVDLQPWEALRAE